MARKPRYFVRDVPQHVIQRGNNRAACFFANDDYRRYRDDLKEVAAKHGCAIHAYVFMTNHVHALVTPQEATSIPAMMQALGRRYVRYVNGVYRRTGTLWEGRYNASLVQSEHYLLCCYRYIELNPVRAGMVEHPRLYPWSSYHAHAHGHTDTLVDDHPLYRALGSSAHARHQVYRELFKIHLDQNTIDLIRDVTNKAWPLGNERFREQVETALQRRTRPLPRGGARKQNTETGSA